MNSIINQALKSTEILQSAAELKALLLKYEKSTGRDPKTVIQERIALILPSKAPKTNQSDSTNGQEPKFKDATTSPLKLVEQYIPIT